MEEVYANIDDVKPLSSRSSTIQEGPRRLLRASVLGLGLLGVFLLAGLIGLAVHYHNSVGGAAADLSAVKADLTSVTEERDNLTEHLQDRDQRINRLEYRLQCLMEKTCPEGWKMFSCSCYLFLSTEKRSWEQSRDNCTAGGADLVIVDSKEEQKFIASKIKEPTWIGLNDTEEEGTWKWVDGSPLNLNLTFWSTAQPDNFDGEDCVEIRSIVHSQSWNDRPCTNDQHWICEKEA
ncbi:CD209 antigen-like protein E isoform X1 [Trematomus bernacchii]|uniref:CD209 antigen-like protein E isoform X1 n=1 Tax=Trematomus bernacchii TaxID=40690 RepID=UPI00146C54AF|nr:CD209 antigen-like protein E isoform X1 [Trematomus bernacchii]XP_034003334.1 CD209 antigen-like protein E isoform X1 [Trematomus bernacchii]XP_034003335.1 CD209 antigen-like protein E isoform X1 [Trematomus bernacchii]XP_034003336.1 CD209 antigen-like protein E isoform X1 [Trematomus bernacchii]